MNTDLSTSPPVPLIGGHLALDFLNTRYGISSAHRECLVDDRSVTGWMERVGLLSSQPSVVPTGLLALAVALREDLRTLLAAAKAGQSASTDVINNVIADGRVAQQAFWDDSTKTYQVRQQRLDNEPASLLQPVAQSALDLLSYASLNLVRQCEADDCTLVFLDATKSHRRRWCCMALCGNRMKVAAFRERRKAR